MSASNKTVMQMLTILRRHLSDETIRQVVSDLHDEVKGNSSVRATIDMLYAAVTPERK